MPSSFWGITTRSFMKTPRQTTCTSSLIASLYGVDVASVSSRSLAKGMGSHMEIFGLLDINPYQKN